MGNINGVPEKEKKRKILGSNYRFTVEQKGIICSNCLNFVEIWDFLKDFC